MREWEKEMNCVEKSFLANEITSGFPTLGLMKHSEIQMRMDWVNRLEESKKAEFLQDIFERRETSLLVKEFDSLIRRPFGGRIEFQSKKELLGKSEKDGGRWEFIGDGESVSANYQLGSIDLRVTVEVSDRIKNISCHHCIYKKNMGLCGIYQINNCSRFHYEDVWHAENLDADIEYVSVLKVLNCGYDMLSDALLK